MLITITFIPIILAFLIMLIIIRIEKSAVVGKSAEDQAKVAFEKSIQLFAAKSRAKISKNMTPNYFLEEDIPSGCQIQDVLYVM